MLIISFKLPLNVLVQSVQVELALPAVTTVNVTTVILVTGPAAVTQVLGVWPVSSAALHSTDPPVKVSGGPGPRWRLVLQVHHPDCCVFQPVTAQITGHVTMDGEEPVPVSVTLDGPETDATFSRVSSDQMRRDKSVLTLTDCVFVLQPRSSSVLHPVLQRPSVRRTTPVCVGLFTRETDSPVQVNESQR